MIQSRKCRTCESRNMSCPNHSPRHPCTLHREAWRTRLSKRSEKGGGLGALEIRDSDGLTACKILRLADLVKNSRYSSSVLTISLPKYSISMVQVGGSGPGWYRSRK
jgi:hypothetical protein